VHGLGDGAPWIGAQVDQCFGAQASYLVGFYHVSEDLGAAAKHYAPEASAWLHTQQQHLKANRLDTVLAALAAYAEPDETPEAPVNACRRYLANRRHQLDYRRALARGLPIGSGEIESAHRYVVQQSLKRPGAWRTPQNAKRLLALRLNRANRQWAQYWNQITKPPA